MRITGVVKGTEADTVVAANKHMLQIKVLHVLADSVTIEFLCTKPTQTNMFSNFEEWIRDWFNDRQIPSLPGTLLLYSYHSDGSEQPKQEYDIHTLSWDTELEEWGATAALTDQQLKEVKNKLLVLTPNTIRNHRVSRHRPLSFSELMDILDGMF